MLGIAKNRSQELSDIGYISFNLLAAEHLRQLTNYYSELINEDPQHFYSSSHSSNFELRNKTSHYIREIIEPHISKHLTNYKLLGGAFVVKPAHGKGILQAHQDWNLVDEGKYRSYNLWIPLIDVNESNGAMHVLPKSHKKVQTYRGPNIPSPFKNIEQQLWPYLTILPMKAGEALLYDHALLHGSPPNNTDTVRLGIVIGVTDAGCNLQLYGSDNGTINRYECDVDFFLSKNVMSDYLNLPCKSTLTGNQKLYTMDDFKTIFLAANNKSIVSKTSINEWQDNRTFFEKYTPKNILAEIGYRLGKKNETSSKAVITPQTETIPVKKDVAKFYNEQTDNFLKVYGEVIQAFRTKNVSTLLDYQINTIGLKENLKVLDAGCGVCGPASYFADKVKCHIEALTISKRQVELANEKIASRKLENYLKVKEGDYHYLENYYPANSFDVIYFLESFGHAVSQEQVLHSVWNVLKPGGSVYIKDLFIKKTPSKSMEVAIQKELNNINNAYHYNVPDLNTILDIARKKGYIISSIKTIDIPLEEFENLTISNEFQELTGINKIDNLREYVFPVDFFELKLIKPDINPSLGNSRYFLQNMYLMQIEKWKEKEL